MICALGERVADWQKKTDRALRDCPHLAIRLPDTGHPILVVWSHVGHPPRLRLLAFGFIYAFRSATITQFEKAWTLYKNSTIKPTPARQ
jgi:hypothetical protein